MRFFSALFLFSALCGYGQSPHFKKTIITTNFISEGVAVGDVNKDGRTDIMAGDFWFEAPDWKKKEIAPGKIYNPDTDYSNSFLNFSADVNHDSWIDLIVIDFPGTTAHWFENPKNNISDYWKKHLIYQTVSNESPAFVDVDRDGLSDLLFADSTDKQMIWMKAPAKGSTSWTKYTISEKNSPGTEIFSHGLGWGDINGDHRPDVIIKEGWWECPEDPTTPSWKFHAANLGDQCSQINTMDVNNDGLTDVISASAHLSGVWWHEQLKDSRGSRFEQHVISYAFAESHAVALADFNGDNQPDIVTGKRNLKRNTWKKNPGTHGPPLLYWYEFTPGKEPYWISHEIDKTSGAGLNIAVEDMNKDGRQDFVIANFNGVFLFENIIK